MDAANEDIQHSCAQAQKELGLQIRTLRKRQKLSIAKLASMSGVNHSVLGDIERGHGNPRFATLYKLSKSLDVDLAQLMPTDATNPNG